MDQIPKAVKGTVQALLDKKDEMNIQDRICDVLDLNRVSVQSISLFQVFTVVSAVSTWYS